MATVYRIICFKKKSLHVVRFTIFLPMNASQMNIHAVALPTKTVIKGLSSWSNNAPGTSKLLDLSL